MTRNPEADGLAVENLRHLLNVWNPIGAPDIPEDEYDCLLVPLWNRLRAGAGQASLAEFLWNEMNDHFGMDPESCGTDAFAEELSAWAATTFPGPTTQGDAP